MNKVVNIEIASQVFWIDEQAYELLNTYLLKITQQLNQQENAKDIYYDIELRVAELLFAKNTNQQRALNSSQIKTIIDQVGYIDSEYQDDNLDSITKESHRDVHNEILAGVCAGLALRYNTPAMVFRLLFIILSAIFGLGIVLYVILWLMLDTNNTRKSALAAQGKAQTAQQLASYDQPDKKQSHWLQKIIFSPVSFLSWFLSLFVNHCRTRKRFYQNVLRNMVTVGLLFTVFIVIVLINDFNNNYYLFWPWSWLVSAAIFFLILCLLVAYLRWAYLNHKQKIYNKKVKVIAILSIATVTMCAIYLNYVTSDSHQVNKNKVFNVRNNSITIDINNEAILTGFTDKVDFRIKINPQLQQQLNIEVKYNGYGANEKSAIQNTSMISYVYEFSDNILTLSDQWSLPDDAYNRSQSVEITVLLPPEVRIKSSRRLVIIDDSAEYFYKFSEKNDSLHTQMYMSKSVYIHEFDQTHNSRVSDNERVVLNDKFCEVFFLYQWDCLANIRQSVEYNDLFDQAFIDDAKHINALRAYLLSDRSILINHLREMLDLSRVLSRKYSIISGLHQYINHLITIKSATEPIA